MAYRFAPASNPFVRCSIGAFNGFAFNAPVSSAALIKRNGTDNWQGIHVIDDATNDWRWPLEIRPEDNLVFDGGGGVVQSTATFTSTTDWMIVGYTWDGTATAGNFVWRWKIGTGSWSNETDTGAPAAGAAGSGYRHLIGNVTGLSDDADYDLVCLGAIKSTLSQASFESLTMADIASWDAVFTGASAWMIGCETIEALTDRTGNGGDETSRSAAGVSLVSDPTDFDWGGGGGPVGRNRSRPLIRA